MVVLGKALIDPRVTCGTPGAEGEAGAVPAFHPISVRPRKLIARQEKALASKG
jgi:hypothetical protein